VYAQKSRKNSSKFSEVFGMHPKAAIKVFLAQKSRQLLARFSVEQSVQFVQPQAQKSRSIRFSFSGLIFQGKGTVFEVSLLLQIPYSKLRKGAQISRQSVQHLMLGQPYICTDFWHRN
jgi:hypothetical protein